MMLLQAGQLGLYRKDSIWTSEIPPDMVAGVTMWVDGTDGETLYAGESLDGGLATADGADIESFENKVRAGFGFGIAGADKVRLKLSTTPNGQSAIDSPAGRNTVYQYLDMTGSGSAVVAMSSLLTTTKKLLIAALKVSSSVPFSNSVNASERVFADARQNFGLLVSEDAGQVYVRGGNLNASFIEAIVTQPVTRSQFFVVTLSHQSNQLRLRVNGGAWATQASSTTNVTFSSSPPQSVLATGSAVELAHLATFNTAQTDAVISAVEHWLALDVGITPWW